MTPNPDTNPAGDTDKQPRRHAQEGQGGATDDTEALDTHRGAYGANDTIEAKSMTQTATTTKRGATRTTKPTATPKATRIRWAPAHTCRCKMCGASFQSIKEDARFCGARCRMANHRGAHPLVISLGEGGAGEGGHERCTPTAELAMIAS